MAWDRAQPKPKIQQGSRTLVSPRQVWDVQHSRMAIVHMAKMSESGCGCTQCSAVPPFRGGGLAVQAGD